MIHVRKLVKAGNVSHTVSLPVKWLERHNLKRGDTVYINERASGELGISPHLVSDQKEAREKTIEIDAKSAQEVAREITAGYINNYTSVSLMGDIGTRIGEIRDVVNRFSAFEITEQSPKRAVIKDLLNVKEISVDNTLNRMDMIVRSMFQDLVKGLESGTWDESIVLRDADMDKFYFLMYRLCKMVLKDASISQTIHLPTEEALDKLLLTKTYEALGDHCKELSQLLRKIPKSSTSQFKDALSSIQALYLDAVKSYIVHDVTLAHKVADERPKVAMSLSQLSAKEEKAQSIEALKSMESMTNLIGDLSRITLNKE